jgi:hypothetical protein
LLWAARTILAGITAHGVGVARQALDAVRKAAPFAPLNTIGRTEVEFVIPVRFEVR